jgi:putative intracellular protease/amidase
VDVVIPLYPGFTALDAVGPYEVLSRLPGARMRFVAEAAGPVGTETGMLTLVADEALSAVDEADVLVVPGGYGTRALLDHAPLLDWLRGIDATTAWTTSVCTGALLLGAAGLLDGKPATTHWLELETLARFGACPTSERIVAQGKIVTAAGVSAGIDMALWLAARIAGDATAQAIQLGIEYDPQPPFRAGSVEQAPAEITALVRARAGGAARRAAASSASHRSGRGAAPRRSR